MSSVKPTHYFIRIEPDFTNFTFLGTTVIELTSQEAVSKITLNGVDLEIESCQLVIGESKKDLSFKMDYANEEIHIDTPTEISGNFTIEFKYKGKIGEELKGLYKTKYKVGEEVHYGAITQFENEDARRMFPCFDRPSMKATIELEVILNNTFTVISNTPILSEKKDESGKRIIKFNKTPKMSTYLLFLGMAEFESITDKQGAIDVSVYAHPGLAQYGKDSLDFGKKSLDYCQKYFNIPYPLPKLDLIGTPDFSAGAMENWGAISFRENLLLKFSGSTTKLNEIVNLGVIAHEITHQWYGNLVSPSLWKYIWLNESFADFFANQIVDYYRPELRVWEMMIPYSTNQALIADAYIETVPIEIKGSDKATYSLKSYPIIYAKGGSILRMIEDFIGSESFKRGLQFYLKNHEYGVASSDDLWLALEKYSDVPVSDVMKTWVLQMGYPLLTVTQDKNNNSMTFIQERFTYLENSDSTIWMIPVSIKFFSNGKEVGQKKVLLKSKKETIKIEENNFDTFKINVGHSGFYRVKYPLEEISKLGDMVSNVQLSPLDAWNIVNDISALFTAGKIDLDYFLNFILHYKSEKYLSSVQTISDYLTKLFQLAPEGDQKKKIKTTGVTFHETFLEKIQYVSQKDESFSITVMRNQLIRQAGYLGSKKAIAFGMEQFQLLKDGKRISPDITDSVLSIGASQTNDLEWFLQKFDTAKNEVEIINYGTNLGEFSDVKIISKVIDEIVFSKIPMRNQYMIIDRLCKNRYATGDLKIWKFFLANLDSIGKINFFIQPYVIDFVVTNPSVDVETFKDMKNFFKDYNKTNEIAKETTEKSFETVEINLGIKNRLA